MSKDDVIQVISRLSERAHYFNESWIATRIENPIQELIEASNYIGPDSTATWQQIRRI